MIYGINIINNAGDVTVYAFHKRVSFTGVITVADVTRYAAVSITTSFAVNILIISSRISTVITMVCLWTEKQNKRMFVQLVMALGGFLTYILNAR